MAGTAPVNDQLPIENGTYQPYKAAGKLAGKKAFISGADSGIGRAIAILFAMEGAESTMIYMPEEEKDVQETEKLVEEKGGRLHLIEADLTEKETSKNVINKAVETMGRINILVLNHGPEVSKASVEEDDGWVTTFNSNINPFVLLSEYTIPQMVRGDTIITCAPLTPYVGRPDLVDYTSSRSATIAFTRRLAKENAARGIRANVVCPGHVRTPLLVAAMAKDAQLKLASPMGRLGMPSEVATCFVFLAGPDSSFISGQCLNPNGGTVEGR